MKRIGLVCIGTLLASCISVQAAFADNQGTVSSTRIIGAVTGLRNAGGGPGAGSGTAAAGNSSTESSAAGAVSTNGEASGTVNGSTAANAATQSSTAAGTAITEASTSGNIAAAELSAVTKVGELELARLDIPASASVLAAFEGTSDGDTGVLTLLIKQKRADGTGYWTKISECSAKYGRNGLGKTREGDNKTPVGVFKMNTPFGISPAEAGFPADYVQIDSSFYWNGDSESDRYNKLVSTANYTAFSRKASEHLADITPYYNYCLDTGYNAEGTPYKGSAIFLHCVVGNENTHGCIAIPEEKMKEVLRNYSEGSTYIAIYDKADVSAVYRQNS